MKLVEDRQVELDPIDRGILKSLQDNCRVSLTRIGDQVGLSAPSVIERIKKLEESGVIRGYHAVLEGRRLGLDITAFIGVSARSPGGIDVIEAEIDRIDGVLECHHVTGEYTMLIKVKTANTSSLERLISRLRSIDGVERTETMVVLSTHVEETRLSLEETDRTQAKGVRRTRRNGERLTTKATG